MLEPILHGHLSRLSHAETITGDGGVKSRATAVAVQRSAGGDDGWSVGAQRNRPAVLRRNEIEAISGGVVGDLTAGRVRVARIRGRRLVGQIIEQPQPDRGRT